MNKNNEMASSEDYLSFDPKQLIGRVITVEGKGVGTVVSFEKTLSPATDSLHRIDFSDHGIQKVLLRRRKLGKWNGGLKYTMGGIDLNKTANNILNYTVDTRNEPPPPAYSEPTGSSVCVSSGSSGSWGSSKNKNMTSVSHRNKNEWVSTQGRHFVLGDRRIILRGVNWFGFETDTLVVHGLWCRTLDSMLDQISLLSINMIRIPFCNNILKDKCLIKQGAIDFSINEELIGLTPLEILDLIVDKCSKRNIRVLLDRHRPTFDGQSELWYSQKGEVEGRKKAVKESTWINDWLVLARRYLNDPYVIGADLHNEPHGRATWGDGIPSTDWRLAATKCGNEILKVNSNWLIVVQGIQSYQDSNYWWGGNLKGIYEFPIQLSDPTKLVYSTHDYPVSVYRQEWFNSTSYPNNLKSIWDEYWGGIMKSGVAVLLGEFGTFAENEEDLAWLGEITQYIHDNEMSFTYWCMNPNSGDTGGLLLDNWKSLHRTKTTVLKPLFKEAYLTTLPQSIQSDVAPEKENAGGSISTNHEVNEEAAINGANEFKANILNSFEF